MSSNGREIRSRREWLDGPRIGPKRRRVKRPPPLTLPVADATLPGVERGKSVVTAERFEQGMTLDQYVAYFGSPENLAREAGWWLGPTRHDSSRRTPTS
jgi:hypothetical protein